MTREELPQVAKPILFNTDMVKAILGGKKTVTRRVVKFLQGKNPKWTGYVKDGLMLYNGNNEPCCKKAPYNPGDILYVRESVFQGVGHSLDIGGETVSFLTDDFEYYADGLHKKGHWKDKYERTWMQRIPSLHMPKEAARIFLKVTDVRVERLQEITDEDCEKEGLENFCKKCHALFSDCDTCLNDEGIKEDFKELWNSTIKKSDLHRYGWDANPWVWVIEFDIRES